jgi:hypothetical protein
MIHVANVIGVQDDIQLALVSLQGLVNSTQSRLYLLTAALTHANTWLVDYYKQIGAFTQALNVTTDAMSEEDKENALLNLIYEYQAEIAGLAVIPVSAGQGSPNRFGYRLNAATNAAGVERLLIVTEDLLPRVQQRLPSTPIVRDFRVNGPDDLPDEHIAAWWSAYNFLSSQSTQALANLDTASWDLFTRDYVIAHKIHTFWWPHHTELFDSVVWQKLDAHLRHVLQHAPPNIPILGGWGIPPRGLGEVEGVKTAGQYGKYTVGDSYGGGYSFHSGIQVDDAKFRQYRARARPIPTYQANKKYVALTMMESGDAPSYLQFAFKQNQWGDPLRGTIPISYGISLAARDLAPGLMQYFFETATANDYFFSSISGLGYSYPLEGYGELGVLNNQEVLYANRAGDCNGCFSIMSDYYAQAGTRMSDMDLDVLGLYTHFPWHKWTPQDDTDLRTLILPYIGNKVSAIAADMGRGCGDQNCSFDGNNDGDGDGIVPDPPIGNPNYTTTFPTNDLYTPFANLTPKFGIHHSRTTFWGAAGFGTHGLNPNQPPDFTRPDSEAVNWMTQEIWDYTPVGGRWQPTAPRFLHAMALSWHYGPRRLRQVVQALTSYGYEFVTINELDRLWRQSKGYALANMNPNGVTPGWCTHPGSVLIRGDVNGDHEPDLICHDASGYWWTSGNNLTGTELSTPTMTGWCAGADARLYTADLNGDDITDFLCYYATDPTVRYFAKSNNGKVGSYTITNTAGNTFWNTFCTHQGAWLETALASRDPGKLACYDQLGGYWTAHPW